MKKKVVKKEVKKKVVKAKAEKKAMTLAEIFERDCEAFIKGGCATKGRELSKGFTDKMLKASNSLEQGMTLTTNNSMALNILAFSMAFCFKKYGHDIDKALERIYLVLLNRTQEVLKEIP